MHSDGEKPSPDPREEIALPVDQAMKPKFDRLAYQREYMRRRRRNAAAARAKAKTDAS